MGSLQPTPGSESIAEALRQGDDVDKFLETWIKDKRVRDCVRSAINDFKRDHKPGKTGDMTDAIVIALIELLSKPVVS